MNYILIALSAYLSGSGSFKVKGLTITIQNTGTNPVKFTFATALKAIEEAVLLGSALLPQTVVIGSTSVTVSK
jgi:hypothetical protein